MLALIMVLVFASLSLYILSKVQVAVITSPNISRVFSSSKQFYWVNAFAAVPVICFGFQVHLEYDQVFYYVR
jgi:amino acid permease